MEEETGKPEAVGIGALGKEGTGLGSGALTGTKGGALAGTGDADWRARAVACKAAIR